MILAVINEQGGEIHPKGQGPMSRTVAPVISIRLNSANVNNSVIQIREGLSRLEHRGIVRLTREGSWGHKHGKGGGLVTGVKALRHPEAWARDRLKQGTTFHSQPSEKRTEAPATVETVSSSPESSEALEIETDYAALALCVLRSTLDGSFRNEVLTV